jgi:hypothetical protein
MQEIDLRSLERDIGGILIENGRRIGVILLERRRVPCVSVSELLQQPLDRGAHLLCADRFVGQPA